MITSLKIIPRRVQHGRSATLASGEATLENGVIANFKIAENSKMLYVKWRGIRFVSDEIKKQFNNRVLATYVINHCVNEA